MGRLILRSPAIRAILAYVAIAGLVGFAATVAGRPLPVGPALALVGVAIHALPLGIAWLTLKALIRVPVPLLGFVVAHGLKVLLSLVGLVLAAVWLRTEPAPFVARDLVWVVAGFASATVTYFFVMRKS